MNAILKYLCPLKSQPIALAIGILISNIAFSQSSPPNIIQQPQNQTVYLNGTAQFMVAVEGTQPIWYQWYKDDIPLVDDIKIYGATTPSLLINSVQVEDAGLYYVVVSNSAGVITSRVVELEVVLPGSIADAVESSGLKWVTGGNAIWFYQTNIYHYNNDSAKSGQIGDNQTSWIQTTLVGPGTLFFWWKVSSEFNKDKLALYVYPPEITNSSVIIYDNTTNDLLTTFQLYQGVEAGDQIIFDTQQLPQFPIILNYFSFTYWGNNFSGNEQMNVHFYLNDGNGGAPGSLVWGSGWFDVPQTQKSQVIFNEDFSLSLNTSTLTWSVELRGLENGESAGLWLFSPPVIGNNYTDYWLKTNGNWELRLNPNINLDFEAKFGAQAQPAPIVEISGEVNWEFKAIRIPAGTNIVKWTYSKDSYGSAGLDAAFLDDVSYLPDAEPIIIINPTSQMGIEGGYARFKVFAIGEEPMNYQWKKDGVALEDDAHIFGAHSPQLCITNLQMMDYGSYSVLISNSIGAVETFPMELIVYPPEYATAIGDALDNTNLVWLSGGNSIWFSVQDITHDSVDSISVGLLPDDGESWVETLTPMAGTISFWWKSSTEVWDSLSFMIDDTLIYSISGERDWENRQFDVPQGVHKLRWIYRKNSELSAGLDRVWIDSISFIPTTPVILTHPQSLMVLQGNQATFTVEVPQGAQFQYQWTHNGVSLVDSERVNGATSPNLVINNVNTNDAGIYNVIVNNARGSIVSSNAILTVFPTVPLNVALDNDLVWTTGGAKPWFGTAKYGNTWYSIPARDDVDLAESGAISDNQSSWLQTTVIGPGLIYFQYKVSSEQYFDFLEFWVNGQKLQFWSGDLDWNYYMWQIPPGPAQLKWVYKKDSVYSYGYDRAWLDEVAFIPSLPSPPIIIEPPKNVTVEYGGIATFSVTVDGTWPFYYQWYKDGIPLNDSPNISGSHSPILKLRNINFQNSGEYWVVIGNDLGSVTSEPVNLEVIPAIYWFWRNPLPQGNTLASVAYYNGTYVAVGGAGTILTSTNAIDWLINNTPTKEFLNNITVTPQGVYITGENGTSLFSTNTINWDLIPVPTDKHLFQLLYVTNLSGASGYFIIGEFEGILESTDGTNWVLNEMPTVLKSIVYSGSNLLAVSEMGDVFLSNDGVSWFQNYISAYGIRKVIWTGTNYVIMSYYGQLFTSQDGINWQNIFTSDSSNDFGFNDVIAYPSGWLLVGNYGKLIYYYSQSNWYVKDIDNYNHLDLYGVCKTDKYVIVGEYGAIYRSIDGIEWKESSSGIRTFYNSAVRNDQGIFIAGGGSSELTVVSNNNVFIVTLDTNQYSISKIIWDGTKFIAGGATGIYISTNALNWIKVIDNLYVSTMIYANDRYIVCDVSGSIWISANGIQWDYRTSYVRFYDVINNNFKFYAVGDLGTVWESSDGIFWNNLYYNNDVYLRGLTKIGNVIVAAGYDQYSYGVIINSLDNGLTWNQVEITNITTELTKVATYKDKFLIVGDGIILGSNNGSNWIKINTPSDQQFSGVLTKEDGLVVYGEGGMIIEGKSQEYYGPPVNVSKPVNLQYDMGSSLILTVDAIGGRPLYYQWQLNGVNIPDATNKDLFLKNISLNMQGNYNVVVSNSLGIITGEVAFLTVQGVLPEKPSDFAWARQLSSVNDDEVFGVTVDRNNNIYITGWFNKSMISTYQLENDSGNGNSIAPYILSKYNINGDLVWSKTAQGANAGYAVASDNQGFIYVVGSFENSAAFDNIQVNGTGFEDMFIAKYDTNGNVIWVNAITGLGFIWGTGVNMDSNGNVYVSGNVNNSELVYIGTNQLPTTGAYNSFVAKYSFSGEPLWAKIIGGSSRCSSVKVYNNEVIIAGTFDLSLTINSITINTNSGVYLAKLDENGSVIFIKTYEASPVPIIGDIDIDSGGNILITGSFIEYIKYDNIVLTNIENTNPTTPDIYLAKINNNGEVIWAKNAGGEGIDNSTDITVDANENIYITGELGYPAYFDNILVTSPFGELLEINRNVFIAKYNPDGWCLWIKPVNKSNGWIEDNKINTGNSIAIDNTGKPVVTGIFNSDVIYFDYISLTNKGYNDIFITRMDYIPPVIIAQSESLITLPGTNILLFVEAYGTMPIYYQWYFNATPISNATNSYLQITNISSSNEGNYWVVISNEIGYLQSSNIYVNVFGPEDLPNIVSQPLSQTVIAGSTVVFNVEVTGAQPFTYRWFKNGVPLTDNYKISGSLTPILTIQNVQSTDIGIYNVEVRNQFGGTTSSNAYLSIKPLVAIGNNWFGQTTVPPGLTNVVAIAAGANHSLALMADGRVVAWGWNDYGQCNVPQGLTNVVAISAGELHSLALLSDGTVIGWGNNDMGQIEIPAGLSNVIAISAGAYHSIALKSDGKVVAWGDNSSGQTQVPPDLDNVIAIDAGYAHNIALKNDGTVFVWGRIQLPQIMPPPGLTNIVAVAAGYDYNLALRQNGAVVGWGKIGPVPPNLTNIVAIDTGYEFSLVLRQDGTLLSWQNYAATPVAIPITEVKDVIAISEGSRHFLVLEGDGIPYFTVQPQTTKAFSGADVVFNALAVGMQPVAYQWYKDGLPLLGKTNNILQLRNILISDAGQYVCYASNRFGVVASRTATLSVQIPQLPLIVTQSQDVNVVAGGDLLLSASATGSEPLFYQWLFNGVNIAGGTNSTLSLKNVSPQNAGAYSIIVSNKFGSVTGLIANVTVLLPPVITTQPRDVSIPAGGNATINVVVTGTAPISYQWYRDGASLIGKTNSALNIVNASGLDEGGYYVIAFNAYGSVTSRVVVVNVGFPPVIEVVPSNITVVAGTTANLTVVASGTTPLAYQWLFFGVEIPNATNQTLEIPNISESQAGQYRVRVSNAYGAIESSDALLAVIVQPFITVQPTSKVLKVGDMLQLNVVAGGTPPLMYQWYKDNMPLVGATASALMISNITQLDAGTYWVTISNQAGIVWSADAYVTVQASADFVWARAIGGSGDDSANGVAVDPAGNTIVVGSFKGSINANGNNLSSRGGEDVFVSKYSADGNLIWSVQGGGAGNDKATAVAVDRDGSIYVVGAFERSAMFGSTNIGLQSSGYQSGGIIKPDTDIFIAKYNPNGTLVWVKQAGGYGIDSATGVAVDKAGNVIVIGHFDDLARFGQIDLPALGDTDIFVAKYRGDGELLWAINAGGQGYDDASAVAVDDSGNIYITGQFNGTARFDNVFLYSRGDPDGFVAKYTSAGRLVWIKQFSGEHIEVGKAITVDPYSNNITVAGAFGEPFEVGEDGKFDEIELTTVDGLDVFIVNLDSNGKILWARGLNWSGNDTVTSIATDRRGALILSGARKDGTVSNEIVVAKLDTNGNVLFLITPGIGIATDVAVDLSDNIFGAGLFKGAAQFGQTQLTSAGGSDGFIGKISMAVGGPPIIVREPENRSADVGGYAKFEVGAAGAMPLYYQWYKGETLIPNATNGYYEIIGASSSDEGGYYVSVVNQYGSAVSRVAYFRLSKAPSIITEPEDVTASVGLDALIFAEVTGTEPMEFRWYHNGELVPWANTPYLYLSELEEDDSGTYQLVVENASGRVYSRVALLSVGTAPRIKRQPKDQQVVAGLSAQFSVVAGGSEPLSYQWWFNNAPLSGRTNAHLLLQKVNSAMAGIYYVVVSNQFGAVTSAVATLTVALPPQIVTQPISQLVPIGGTATFTVVPLDGAQIRYQWFLNDKPINNATNATLVVTNAGFSDAGAYYVVLYNFIGSTRSDTALLRLQLPTLPLVDPFESRVSTNSVSGFGRADNRNATRLSGEPFHGGKRGTNSVWISWVPPISGIATVNLEGSSFDTLLSVYTGETISNLTRVASNDDADIGVKYSKVEFNATAGNEYIIAIDGLGGGGEVVMRWSIEATAAQLPEIAELLDTNVVEGESITFDSGASALAIVNWYFNGVLILSNSPTLTINNMSKEKVGIYQATIQEGNRIRKTRPIRLQITYIDGTFNPVISSQDKFGDILARVFENIYGTLSQNSERRIVRNQGPSRGFTGSQVFSTYGSTTDPGEPLHCGVLGGASEWFVYQAPTNGVLTVDTLGSTFDTVLAVYDVAGNLPPNDYTDLRPVACNNDIDTTNNLSMVSFTATAETIYYIAVDGVGGARGVVQLNYNLVPPPVIVSHPESKSVVAGTNVTFNVTASGTNLVYQWKNNSINIAGATNSSLVLSNVQPASAGNYSVVVSNIAGTVVSASATLTISTPPTISANPTNVVGVRGATVVLSVTATGTAPLYYQWRKDGTNVASATNSTLTLNNVQPTASGSYTVVITNAIGSVTSSPALLAVIEAQSQSVTNAEDTVAGITLGPASTNGIIIFYGITSQPSNGSLSGSGNFIIYTPASNYYGSDSFSFTVSDGLNISPPATVSITVTPVNDAPVLSAITNVVEYANTPITFVCSATDVDTPVSNLTFSLGAGAPAGASINATTGLFQWTPTPSQAGTNMIQFIVSDNGTPNLSSTQAVTFVILPLNPIYITSIEALTNGLIKLTAQGRMARTNTIESTVTFLRWNEETNIVPTNEIFEWYDNATNQNRKFYRLKVSE